MVSKAYRDKWNSEGKCVNCGRLKEETRADLRLCLVCAQKDSKKGKDYYLKNNNFKFRNRDRKSRGVCVTCGVKDKPLKVNIFKCVDCSLTDSKASQRLKFAIIQKYGGKCVCCGEDYYPFLSIDHINNDGNIRRKNEGSGPSLYKKLIKAPIDISLQVLCYNCNFSKRITGRCAHLERDYFLNALIKPKRGRKLKEKQ